MNVTNKRKIELIYRMMMMSFRNFIKETYEYDVKIYRNTDIGWIKQLLTDGEINRKFTSFSFDEESGGQDNFGDVRIIFDYEELKKQGVIEIIYDVDWFEKHTEICMYVTAYENEEDFYKQKGYKDAQDAWDNIDLDWETYLEDYSIEEELVIEDKLVMVEGLIVSVELEDDPDIELKNLLDKYNIEYNVKEI